MCDRCTKSVRAYHLCLCVRGLVEDNVCTDFALFSTILAFFPPVLHLFLNFRYFSDIQELLLLVAPCTLPSHHIRLWFSSIVYWPLILRRMKNFICCKVLIKHFNLSKCLWKCFHFVSEILVFKQRSTQEFLFVFYWQGFRLLNSQQFSVVTSNRENPLK